jgi:hypothetical protein
VVSNELKEFVPVGMRWRSECRFIAKCEIVEKRLATDMLLS